MCPICGHSDDHELISHIENKHEGGLSSFLLIFTGIPVVSEEIYSFAENLVNGDENVEGWPFDSLTAFQIVTVTESQMPERSQIVVTTEANDVVDF